MLVDDWTTRGLFDLDHAGVRWARAAIGVCALLATTVALMSPSLAVCGDGTLDTDEECDDGNGEVGDGCSVDCTVEPWISQVCSTGRDGSFIATSEDEIINTYYAAPTKESVLSAGSMTIQLGAPRGASHKVAVGDRLMIIQMQGAEVDSRPGIWFHDAYGDGPGSLDRAGYKAGTLRAGAYELVVVVAAPQGNGGPLAIRGRGLNNGLVHGYTNSRVVSTVPQEMARGFQTYQIIWIPQYSDLTVAKGASIRPSIWDGNSGGILAIDVLETLTLMGTIDASGRGFRGGRANTLHNGGIGGHDGLLGFKGESVAGMPARMYVSDSAVFASSGVVMSGDIMPGYPTWTYPSPAVGCVGAPGNAGGNARSSVRAGGGGGGGGGRGGRGGTGNSFDLDAAGIGGAPLVHGADSLSLGGGGGGGNADVAWNGDVEKACSGHSGGGIVMVRAGGISIPAAESFIHSNGAGGSLADSVCGGGGGGGGSIIVYTDKLDLRGLWLEAHGGNGVAAARAYGGGGGGGGGGRIYLINSMNAQVRVQGGTGGASMSGFPHNGRMGDAGFYNVLSDPPSTLVCAFDRDTDFDGVLDGSDECPDGDDTVDTDADGTADACDACPTSDDHTDGDMDGIPDECDACPNSSDYTDTDMDGILDDCDACEGHNDRLDGDGDGVPDGCDVCEFGDDNVDTDDDGTADVCDRCEGHDDTTDGDDDGIPDGCDICLDGDDSIDTDSNGTPDACDPQTAYDLTGGACTASSAPAWYWPLLALLALLLAFRSSRSKSPTEADKPITHQRRKILLASVVTLACSTTGALTWAHAQQLSIAQYQPPALASDGLVLATPSVSGHLALDAQMALDYANDPLVVRTGNGGSFQQSRVIVGSHLVNHLVASLGLYDRFLLFAGMPIHLALAGEPPMSLSENFARLKAHGGGYGDLYLGGRYAFGVVRDVRLAAQLTLTAPTAASWKGGDEMMFAGHSSATLHPQVLAQMTFGRFQVDANLGLRMQQSQALGAATYGSALTFAVGVNTPIVRGRSRIRVDGYAELHGAVNLGEFLSAETSPISLLLGAKTRVANGLTLGAGLGPGVLRGIGAPDIRLLWSIAWSGHISSRNYQGSDRDRDGVLDRFDQCPDEREDRDNVRDGDGCPELDGDLDGVLDDEDGAPLKAEDIDGYRDSDGVPDPDNDKDGFLDEIDECPDHAENVDGVADTDGCPD